jgi:7tm Odorant receptor
MASYSLWLIVFSVTGMDSLLMGCCIYIAGQFEIVERQISDLDSNSGGSKEINSKLIAIVERHIRTITLCDRMVKIFAEIVLTQIISNSLVAAMVSFNMILAVGANRITYVCYFAAIVSQMYFCCRTGTILTNSVSRTRSF